MECTVSTKALLAKPVNEASIPAHLKCIACAELVVNCFQTETGFRLCQHCVGRLHPTLLVLCPGTSDADDEACNRMVSRATLLPDLATRREMSKLPVFCPNADCGCRVQLIWKNVDSHLISECDFEMSQCLRCSEYIVLKKLHSCHRDLLARDCCPNFYSPCSLCRDISQLLNCKTISEHQTTTCPAQPTACKYASYGCMKVMPRSQLQRHYKENNDEHLDQTVRHLAAKFQETCQGLRARLDVAEADGIDKDNKLKQMNSEVAQLKEENEEKQLAYESLHARLELVEAEATRLRQENREKDKKLDMIQQLLCTLQSRIDVLEASKVRDSSNKAVETEIGKLFENSNQVTQERIDATTTVHTIQQTSTPRTSATSKHRRNLSLADNSLMETTPSRGWESIRNSIGATRNRMKPLREGAIVETNTIKMVKHLPVSHRRSASHGSFSISRDKTDPSVDPAKLDNFHRQAHV